MNTIGRMRYRLALDIELTVSSIKGSRWHNQERDTELCERVQAIVLRSPSLLEKHINFALSFWIDTLDREQVNQMLGWTMLDPYDAPETLLHSLSEADAQSLQGRSLCDALEEIQDSFDCKLTGVRVQTLDPLNAR
jgi:hypothetical protein